MPLLDDAIAFDRADGQDLSDRAALAAALGDRDAVVHLAALHPLVAPRDADAKTYRAANVDPFVTLLDAARTSGVRRVVLASSTSVWRDSPPGRPARFLDETSATDGDDGYARSKLECERLLRESGIDGVVLRLARFATSGDPEDEVRKLYRAIDPRDIATAIVAALEHAPAGATYAISAPTPFTTDDARELDRDPASAIRRRTGRPAAWAPGRIGSVVVATKAERGLGWRCAFPSALLG